MGTESPRGTARDHHGDEATSSLAALDATPEAKARLLRTLLGRTEDVNGIFEKSGTAVYISPAVERLLGWRPEEMIGACACARLAAAAAPQPTRVLRQLWSPRRLRPRLFHDLTRCERSPS